MCALAAGLAVGSVGCSSTTPGRSGADDTDAPGADDDEPVLDASDDPVTITEITFHDDGCADGIKTDGCPKDFRFHVHFENSSDEEHHRYVVFTREGDDSDAYFDKGPHGDHLHDCGNTVLQPDIYGCDLDLSGHSSTYATLTLGPVSYDAHARFKTCIFPRKNEYPANSCRDREHKND